MEVLAACPADELGDGLVPFPSGLSHMIGSEWCLQLPINDAKYQVNGTAFLVSSVFASIVVVLIDHVRITNNAVLSCV